MKEKRMTVPRAYFLKRRAEMTALSKLQATCPTTGFAMHVIDAGDEVLCDFCNADVEEDPIHLNERGTYLVCKECREKP
jgi:hypothetical protein